MSRDLHTMTDKQATAYLKEAGCKCRKSFLSYKKDVGPRCDLCQVQVVMVQRRIYY